MATAGTKKTKKSKSKDEAVSANIVVKDALAVRHRPPRIEDMIGNATAKAVMSGMVKAKRFPNTILLHGGTGMGKCLTGEAILETSDGDQPISEFVKSRIRGFHPYNGTTKLLNMFGSFELPEYTYYDKVTETIKVTAENGFYVRGTPEHPVLGINTKKGADTNLADFHRLKDIDTETFYLAAPARSGYIVPDDTVNGLPYEAVFALLVESGYVSGDYSPDKIKLGIEKVLEENAEFQEQHYQQVFPQYSLFNLLGGRYWNFIKVAKVELIEEEVEVFDVSMPQTKSFVANHLINHNTTAARMLARYANCETGNICGECASCKYTSSHPDVVELNMADSRGIDDVRDLIAKSKLAPRFNYRVFILDELHGITPQAKEAMLKPLEEPPAKTLWVLCTTEPQKLTPTILGRCKQIKVEPPETNEMARYLARVLRLEGHKMTSEIKPVILHIARSSMGHSRNALQMLDTLIDVLNSEDGFTEELAMTAINASSGDDIDDVAMQLLAAILSAQGKQAIKHLYSIGKDKSTMAVIMKIKWFIDFKLQQWAGVVKYNPPINVKFEKAYGKNKEISTVDLIDVLNTVVKAETDIKSIPGLDERAYFSAIILDRMTKIANSK